MSFLLSEWGASLLGGGYATRQGKGEFTVLAVIAGHGYGLSVSLDDGLGYEHTQTHTALIQAAALVALIEALKDEGEILRGDTLSLVVDLDHRLTVSSRLSGRPGKAQAQSRSDTAGKQQPLRYPYLLTTCISCLTAPCQ